MKKKENLYFADSVISGLKFRIFASPIGIKKILLNKKSAVFSNTSLTKLQPEDPYMFGVFDQLKEYLNGERKKFNVPLDIKGTDFQIKVWNELIKIPYGKVSTYKKISKTLGSVNLVRAVGKANSTNPVPVLIPCHRVINSNGKLGGYTAGVKIKEKLLEVEGYVSLELFE